jgi:hypothetical protein
MPYMPTTFEEANTEDVLARVSLMESLIEQGRASARRWGEFAVLWGTGSLIAYLWEAHTGNWHSWLWLDAVAYPLEAILWIRRWRQIRAITQSMRFVNALWLFTGLSMNLLGFSGLFQTQMSGRAINQMVMLVMGTANLVSGTAFRWPLQIIIGAMFWGAAIAFLFVNGPFYFWTYVSATFFGEVCFGIYLLITERKNQYA